MLNVIIASQDYIDALNEHRLFLDAYLQNNNTVFCCCDYSGRTLSEMIPDLENSIPGNVEWKAIVIAPDARNQLNPFDYVGYTEIQKEENEGKAEYIKRRRSARFAAYEKGSNNPLTKLITALNGPDFSKRLMDRDEYIDICSGKVSVNRYLLDKYLSSVNLTRVVRWLKKPGDSVLERMLGTEKYNGFIDVLEKADSEDIISYIGDDSIIDVLSVLSSGDLAFSNVDFLESSLENYKRFELLKPLSASFEFNNEKPSEVICVALRTYDIESYSLNRVNKTSADERKYSDFAEYNLYGGNAKFLVYDIFPKNDKRYGKELVKFLLAVMTLTKKDIPIGVLEKKYLYRLNIDFDENRFSAFCSTYISKLTETRKMLLQKIVDCKQRRCEHISRTEAEKIIETDPQILIENNHEYPEDNLKANFDNIGLAGDCPKPENEVWSGQKRKILSEFTKYLRQPRYAIKNAVNEDFRNSIELNDERILGFSDAQLDDVEYYLRDQENKMVNTTIPPIFSNTKYNEMLDQASKEIENAIEKRMTKRKTVIIGAICALATFLGFLPLFYSQLASGGPLAFSFVLTLATIAVLMLIGFGFLFKFRNSIKSKFKDFNNTVTTICLEVKSGLSVYAGYLVNVSNVMRSFKILNYTDDASKDEIKTLKMHIVDLENKIQNTRNIYSDYLNNMSSNQEEEVFDYDFSVPVNYNYLPESDDKKHLISFFHTGIMLEIPVDYINAIDAVKEDLYE
jgi:hypothetical protein